MNGQPVTLATKLRTEMRDLVKVLILGSALSLSAGAAAAWPTVELHCSETSCQYNEEIGPSGTKTYEGFCYSFTGTDSKMVCHKAKGLTCTQAIYVKEDTPPHWACTCTNWNPAHEAHTDIDMSCPSPG